MDRRIAKNYAINLAYQILLLAMPLVTTPYVSQCLGVENVGIFSFTSSNVSYFVLFVTFGFHVYGQREIARYQNDIENRSQLLFEIQVKKFLLSVITIIAFVVFALFQTKYRTVYLIQTLTIISTFFDISYFFQGLELYNITVIRNAFFRIIGVVCIFVFIHEPSDLYLYVFLQCLVGFLGSASLWMYLKKYVSKKYMHRFKLSKDFRIILELFIPVISVQLYFHIDKTMLGIICDTPVENGYYEQALKIVRICQTVITSLGAVLISSVSRMIGEKDYKKMDSTIHASIRFGLFLSIPMMLGLIGISDVLVPWFFGNGYEGVTPVMCVLAPIIVLSAISNVATNGILIPLNRHNYVSLAMLWELQ